MNATNISFYKKTDFKREINISEKPWRSPFNRDYARLLHSPSFRRLQGKTQLFPGLELDFFRNRLTHSLEVAQISKGIAEYINYKLNKITNSPIDLDLVQFSALAHDLGHPPFGHNGEAALNEKMKNYGGFESNAQNLRILASIEKKFDTDLMDYEKSADLIDYEKDWYKGNSVGLNLCYRSLASILKYDSKIDYTAIPNNCDKLKKGYYCSEEKLVQHIKQNVIDKNFNGKFKTIECQIMDLADDIAYSTYDIEDALKGEILTLFNIYYPQDEILEKIRKNTNEELNLTLTMDEIQKIIYSIFESLDFPASEEVLLMSELKLFNKSGFYRTQLTTDLVKRAIHSVNITINKDYPPLSKIEMDPDIRLQTTILKHLVYAHIINSNKLKIVDYRGKKIVQEIFDALSEEKGYELLPDDFKKRADQAQTDGNKKRIICDFIACMTDRYALEFYSRLTSEDFQTMYRPYV